VAFVEGVLREGLPVRPDLVADLGVEATFCRALQELAFHLVQRGAVLFAHRLPQHVGIAFGEAR
jgi:hypothetical protein